MNWILSWNEKNSSSIISYSVHPVHPGHHLFLSSFCLFLRICILCAYAQQVFLGCSPKSNFIYNRNSQTERLMLRSGVGKLSWQELDMATSLAAWASAAFVYIWGTNIFFSSWIPAFQCTLINSKTKWSQHKMIIKIKLKPMCILLRWHTEHPLVVQRVPTPPRLFCRAPCSL